LRPLPCVIACIVATACGGGSPSSPSPIESIVEFVFRGETVNAIDGSPIGRVTVKIGSQVTQSDERGRFDLRNLQEGAGTIVISGSAIIERQRTITFPGELSRRSDSLVVRSGGLHEMLRGGGRLQRCGRWLQRS
jgi:hypothetical protein